MKLSAQLREPFCANGPHVYESLSYPYLEHEQYEVLMASEGRTALELALAVQPDLVVLDVMLPELDGIEVCCQLRQFPDAYVILLTTRAEGINKLPT